MIREKRERVLVASGLDLKKERRPKKLYYSRGKEDQARSYSRREHI
jgi:hypothetical protein